MKTIIQEWQGHVIEFIEKAVFIARLKDLTNGGTDELVRLGLDEIVEEDLDLVKVGAIFHWSIGYERVLGELKKTSKIRFYRSEPFNEDEIKQALDRAEELYKHLKFD